MCPRELIDKYYPEADELKHILLTHSRSVADKALWIADNHPELSLDRDFLYEAAMLHDIGIFLTDADGICCFGDKPLYLPWLFRSGFGAFGRLPASCFGM